MRSKWYLFSSLLISFLTSVSSATTIEEDVWVKKLSSGHSEFLGTGVDVFAKPKPRSEPLKITSGQYQRIPTYNVQAPSYAKHNPLWIDIDNDGVRELFSTDFHPEYMETMWAKNASKGVTLFDSFFIHRFNGDVLKGEFRWKQISEERSSVCTHARKAIAGDFNNDGFIDVVVACHGYDRLPFPGSKTVILVNNGDRTFTEKVLPETGFWHNVASADFNNDGNMDLLMSDSNWNDPKLFVLLNDGKLNFTKSTDYFNMGWGRKKPYFAVGTTDVNRDGRFDVFLASDEEGHSADTLVILNDGSNKFSISNGFVLPRERKFTIPLDIYVHNDDIYVLRAHNNNGYKGSAVQKVNLKSQQAETLHPVVCGNGVPCSWVWQRWLTTEIDSDGQLWLISHDFEHRDRKIKLD